MNSDLVKMVVFILVNKFARKSNVLLLGRIGIVINSGFPLITNTSAEYLEIQDRSLQFGVSRTT